MINFAELQYVSVGLECLLFYTSPTFAVVGGFFLFGQQVGGRVWGAVILTELGIAVAYSGQSIVTGIPIECSMPRD